MRDHAIRLTLPPDADLAAVASIAVRAAARQVALAETEIDRLRVAVAEAFTRQTGPGDDPIEVVLHPGRGSLRIEVGSTTIE